MDYKIKHETYWVVVVFYNRRSYGFWRVAFDTDKFLAFFVPQWTFSLLFYNMDQVSLVYIQYRVKGL